VAENEDRRLGESGNIRWQAFLIAAISSFGPLQVWVNNPESPPFLSTALVILALTGVGLLARLGLVKAGWNSNGATFFVVFVIGVIFNAGPLVYTVPGGRWTLIGCAFLLGAIAYRLRSLQVLQFLVIWGVVALMVMPVVAFAETLGSGPMTVTVGSANGYHITSRPDVVVVVADAYGSDEVLQEFYGFDNSGFREDLEEIGLTNGTDVRANYPLTGLSVSSALNLDYAVGEQHLSRGDLHLLYDMVGGNNTMARILKDAGYRQTYVESGWFGTRCRSEVDNCIEGPWPDETFYDIARRSVMRGLPGLEDARSFSRGALHAFGWVNDEMADYLANGEPDLIYVHLLSPHPPFFLNSSCEARPDMALGGFTTGIPGLPEQQAEERRDGYVEQVECVNQVLTSMGQMAVANGAVIAMFGDHGPDGSAQLFIDGDQWTDEQLRERFGVMFAGYGPGCDFTDIGSLVNVSRRIISCLAEEDVPDLPRRAYVRNGSWDMTEVDLSLAYGQ
jgi:Sulfatase